MGFRPGDVARIRGGRVANGSDGAWRLLLRSRSGGGSVTSGPAFVGDDGVVPGLVGGVVDSLDSAVWEVDEVPSGDLVIR